MEDNRQARPGGSEHPNATMVRTAWNAAVRGQADAAEYLADDIEWHEIGLPTPIAGKQAVLEHMGTPTGWQVRPVLHDVVANDDHAVVLINARASRAGRTFEYRVTEIYDLRDGKVTKRYAMSDDTARIAEFFG